MPSGLTRASNKDIEMQRGKVHRHVAVVADARPHAHAAPASKPLPNGMSLLALSVPARLLIVAIASALLWGAVLWALR